MDLQQKKFIDGEATEEVLEARLLPPRAVIYERGGPTMLAKTVKEHLEELLDLGEKHNERTWRVIVNPKPLMGIPFPGYHSKGSATEAQLLVMYQLALWQETWGAIDMLKLRVGPNPKYDANVSRF